MGVKLVNDELYAPADSQRHGYFDADPSVTVQVKNSDGACWTSGFTTAQIKNTAVQFSATGP
jgi:hypothetical protein